MNINSTFVLTALALGSLLATPAPAAALSDAADDGFLPEASGVENSKALRRAVDRAGTIVVSRPGTCRIAATVYLGSITSLIFGHGVFLRKVAEQDPFTQVLLNKGALTKMWDEHIAVTGLHIILNGVVENMHDLSNPERQIGYFCCILAGAWLDWRPGLGVQQSDTVVSEGRLYRVQADPDGTVCKSVTRPTHKSGAAVLDGINWGVVQDDVTYTAGVRNVVLRDIFPSMPRTAFSIHFDVEAELAGLRKQLPCLSIRRSRVGVTL